MHYNNLRCDSRRSVGYGSKHIGCKENIIVVFFLIKQVYIIECCSRQSPPCSTLLSWTAAQSVADKHSNRNLRKSSASCDVPLTTCDTRRRWRQRSCHCAAGICLRRRHVTRQRCNGSGLLFIKCRPSVRRVATQSDLDWRTAMRLAAAAAAAQNWARTDWRPGLRRRCRVRSHDEWPARRDVETTDDAAAAVVGDNEWKERERARACWVFLSVILALTAAWGPSSFAPTARIMTIMSRGIRLFETLLVSPRWPNTIIFY